MTDFNEEAFQAVLIEGNLITPDDEFGQFHLDEGALRWLWVKAIESIKKEQL